MFFSSLMSTGLAMTARLMKSSTVNSMTYLPLVSAAVRHNHWHGRSQAEWHTAHQEFVHDTCLKTIDMFGVKISRRPPKKNPLGAKVPYAKGVVLKLQIKKPKKPNSANRKCVLTRLSTGKEVTAYVPGEGHNLQEHNTVLVRVGNLRDVPGVKCKCVRGAYDLGHVLKKVK